MSNFKKWDKCIVFKTMTINDITYYIDSLGSTVRILEEAFKKDDITYYLVYNITREYLQYVPSTIIELV